MDRSEALRALGDVDVAQRRSCAIGYSAAAAPYLIVWGAIWLVCNTASQLQPQVAGPVWIVGVGAGFFVNVVLGLRRAKAQQIAWNAASGSYLARWLGATAAVVGFYAICATILGIQAPGRQMLFASLLVALCYTLIGIWQAAPLAFAGVGLAALLLAGWYAAPAWFLLWVGICGGGALILTGLWMRRR